MAAIPEPCITCGGDDFVEFKSEGDLVCRHCGTVKESHLIDERSEWRTFSDKDKDTTDPNRVGGPTNHLLEGLTTTIGRERNDGGLSHALNRIHARTNNPDRALVAAFKEVSTICDHLKVKGGVKDRACEEYKAVVEAKTLKGRSVKALAAACVFLACRHEKQARTFKEITAVMGSDVSKKEIGRCFKDLQQLKKEALIKGGARGDALASSMNQTVQHPKEFVLSYCNDLKIDFKVKKAAEQIAINAKPQDRRVAWDGRTPTSIASAIVYITVMLEELRKDDEAVRAAAAGTGPPPAGSPFARARAIADTALQHVALVSSVAETTIKAAYKDLYPVIPELLPPKWLPAEDVPHLIARLPNHDGRAAGGAAAAAGAGANGAAAMAAH